MTRTPNPNKREILHDHVVFSVAPGATADDIAFQALALFQGVDAMFDIIHDGLSDEDSEIAANPKIVARAIWTLQRTAQMVKGMYELSHSINCDALREKKFPEEVVHA